MSHSADDWNRGGIDSAGNDFFVKRPEVFQGSAPSPYNNDVHIRERVEVTDRLCYLLGGTYSLDFYRRDNDLKRRESSPENVEYILNRGSCRRCYDRDFLRVPWQWFFVSLVEKSLRFQLLFEAVERELQITHSDRLQLKAIELIVTPRFIHRNIAANNNFHAVVRTEEQLRDATPPHYCGQLRSFIFERKVQMSRRVSFAVGNLALHPDFTEAHFENAFNTARNFGNRDDVL